MYYKNQYVWLKEDVGKLKPAVDRTEIEKTVDDSFAR